MKTGFGGWTQADVDAHNRKFSRPKTPAVLVAERMAGEAKKKSQRLNVACGSTLEQRLVALWRGPVLEREHKFHPARKWKFDFAHPQAMVAVEVEGGQWGTGPKCGSCGQRRTMRHQTGTGYGADCEKYNEAALMGWVVIRLTGEMVARVWLERVEMLVLNRLKRNV